MNTYEVTIIYKEELPEGLPITEYLKAADKTSVTYYCKGIAELREKCGGHLHLERYGNGEYGYAGFNGKKLEIEYIARKCKKWYMRGSAK